MNDIRVISDAVRDGDDERVSALVQQALDRRISARAILNDGLLPGMDEVGRLFREGEYFLPEVLVAADAMKVAMELLQPRLAAEDVRPEWTAVIGTVAGDLHDIGKNLFGTMLRGSGFEVVDLGVDAEPQRFLDACRAQTVHVVGLSALLTTTMPQMNETLHALRTLDRPPLILVGGAPVTQRYADEIGADGYGADAASGAELAKRLCRERRS